MSIEIHPNGNGGIPLCIMPEADDPESFQAFVKGQIGQDIYTFLLDTGAARSAVISNSALMALESNQSETASGGFGKAREEALIIMPEMQVGPLRIRDFTVVRLPQQEGAHNLLGMDILGQYGCHFCFSAAMLRVNAPGASWTDTPLMDLCLDDRRHPYLTVETDSGLLSAVWDSGAGMTVVDLSVIDDNLGLFEKAGESIGMDATGVRRITPVFLMDEIRIGGWLFPPHKVVGVDLSGVNAGIQRSMDLILGGNLIFQDDWWFDFPHRQWAITSRSGSPDHRNSLSTGLKV